MTSRMTPLDGLHDDERMLDQLASRSYTGDDQLGVTLDAWAKRLDAETAAATARVDIDELVRRHPIAGHKAQVAEPPTRIRIRASRLLGTLGGVGVAATALGIALANGYHVPGFPALTPSQSSSVVLNQGALVARAVVYRNAVERGTMKQQDAIARIEQLAQQATDDAVKHELREVVKQVKAAKPPAVVVPRPTASPSAVPTHLTLESDPPSVMTTPQPQTTPAPPEKTASTQEKVTTTTRDTSLPITGGIPVDATTTPAPTTKASAPVPPSTGSTTAQSSKPSDTSSTRRMPGRTRTHKPARETGSAASAPAGDLTGSPGSEVGTELGEQTASVTTSGG